MNAISQMTAALKEGIKRVEEGLSTLTPRQCMRVQEAVQAHTVCHAPPAPRKVQPSRLARPAPPRPALASLARTVPLLPRRAPPRRAGARFAGPHL